MDTANTKIVGPAKITMLTDNTTIFVVTADDCVIEGLTLVQTGTGTDPVTDTTLYGAGVGVSNCSRTVVRNCVITGAGDPAATGAGVYLSGATAALVTGNRISGGAMGVNVDAYLGESGGNSIIGNVITSTNKGIVIDLAGAYVATNGPDVVSNNVITDTTLQGILFGSCQNGFTCSGNRIERAGSDGIGTLIGSQGGTITGNVSQYNTQSGINLFGGANFTVTGNLCQRNTLYGLNLAYSANSNIVGNQFFANTSSGISGIVSTAILKTTIIGNIVSQNGTYGVNLDNPYDMIIANNMILRNGAVANTYAGLRILGTVVTPTNVLIAGNNFQSNDVNTPSHAKYSFEYIPAVGSNIRLRENNLSGADTAAVSTAWAGISFRDNTGYITETRGATSVADGGTVTHGMGATPVRVVVTPSVSGEMVSVTTLGATTFTVAIKKHDGTAGTTQTVYWQAER